MRPRASESSTRTSRRSDRARGSGSRIVKKIVVEHNGSIVAGRSARLGGAEFVLVLPLPNSLASGAVVEQTATVD